MCLARAMANSYAGLAALTWQGAWTTDITTAAWTATPLLAKDVVVVSV